MSFKEMTVVRILLLVAKMLSQDPWRQEIKDLVTHISVHGGEKS